MKVILNRLYVFIPMVLVAMLQNVLHEGLHFLAARFLGEGVLEFRLFTNGWLTSQVIYATPMEQRTEAYWLVIAWLPALVTTAIGFAVYANRSRWLTPWPPVNLGIWYVGVLFMTIDPLYFGVISWFMGGSDVNAAAILGWPVWPFQVMALLVSALAVKGVLSWRAESQAQVERYRLKM